MAVNNPRPGLTVLADGAESSLARSLERGEVVHFPVCPFPLPEGDDRQFLLEQRMAGRAHKNISYNPHTDRTHGFERTTAGRSARLHQILASFSESTTRWLSATLPRYAAGW